MKSLVSSALSLTMALGAVGCAGPRMVAPADVAQGSEVLEVTDRSSMSGSLVNESFKLGSFAVSDVDRDWNKQKGFSVAGYSNATTTTGYSYKLKAGPQAWNGSCASSANDKGVKVMGGSVDWGTTKITCECKQGGTSATVVLNASSPDSDRNSAGVLTVSDAKYKVSSVNDTDKTNLASGAAGFRYDGEEGALGAVEVLHPGRVWLNARLPEPQRLPVACVSAGLMLYQPPPEQ